MFYQKMLARSQKLEEEMKVTKELIATFPEGEFFSFKNGKFYKWFYKNGKNKRIVKKEERKFAEQMSMFAILPLKAKPTIPPTYLTTYGLLI